MLIQNSEDDIPLKICGNMHSDLSEILSKAIVSGSPGVGDLERAILWFLYNSNFKSPVDKQKMPTKKQRLVLR
jgi:hypothetical protein